MSSPIKSIFRLLGSRPSVAESLNTTLGGLGGIRNSTGEESTRMRLNLAVETAARIESERRINRHPDPFFANPYLIAANLRGYNADENTIIAGILYSAVRPAIATTKTPDFPFDPKYIDEIRTKFGPEVADIVLNALKVREVNLLPRPDLLESANTIAQTDEERIKNILHMSHEVSQNQKANLIRLIQRKINLENFVKAKADKKLTDQERADYVLSARRIYIPVLDYNILQAQKEGDKELAESFRRLKDDMSIYCLQLSSPLQFEILSNIIRDKQAHVLQKAGKGGWEKMNAQERLGLLRDVLEEQIMASVPPELQPYCSFEMRIKNPDSLHIGMQKKGERGRVDLTDIVAARIVVKHPKSDTYRTLDSLRMRSDWSTAEKSRKLHPAKREEIPFVNKIREALVSPEHFQEDTVRFKDFIADPLAGGKREDKGYRAVHMTLLFGNAPVEVQIAGHAMHWDNTFGPAAWWRYKNNIDLDIDVTSTITVHGPNNDIYVLPAGATVADLAAQIGPDYAFTCESFEIRRSAVFGPVEDLGFATPLVTADKVEFVRDPVYAMNIVTRQLLIDACTSSELRQKLLAPAPPAADPTNVVKLVAPSAG